MFVVVQNMMIFSFSSFTFLFLEEEKINLIAMQARKSSSEKKLYIPVPIY